MAWSSLIKWIHWLRLLQVVIDLGLSQQSTIAEDKAVDLYVLERAFRSAHSADGEGLVRTRSSAAAALPEMHAT